MVSTHEGINGNHTISVGMVCITNNLSGRNYISQFSELLYVTKKTAFHRVGSAKKTQGNH